jgi:hypothetical protein
VLCKVKVTKRTGEFVLPSMKLSPLWVVCVHGVGHGVRFHSTGLTELDALGAFREGMAAHKRIKPEDVELEVVR